jgi:hypothetical protein
MTTRKQQIETEIAFIYDLYLSQRKLKDKYLKIYVQNPNGLNEFILDRINKSIKDYIQDIKTLYAKNNKLNLDIDKDIYQNIFGHTEHVSNNFYLNTYS